ncbi:MAG: transcription antitermination factor NusB [Oscillospiraceae bacterium]|nr:transcription antitermination factor NusB [Oscillospiraceae bacterium]
MKRSEVREAAFFMLFEKQFRDDTCEEIAAIEREAEEFPLCTDAIELFEKINEKTTELDSVISGFSEKRRVNRIGKVSLTVLRIAVYECLYEENVPVNVAISEAVHLSEKYSFESDTAFVNGVLGAFARSFAEKNGSVTSDNE